MVGRCRCCQELLLLLLLLMRLELVLVVVEVVVPGAQVLVMVTRGGGRV